MICSNCGKNNASITYKQKYKWKKDNSKFM